HSFLECEELCIPGKADVRAVLEVGQDSKPSSDAALFDSWQKRLPKADSAITVTAKWEQGASEDTRPLVLEVSSNDIEDLFPYGADNYEVQAATERVSSGGGKVRFRKTVRKLDGEWPREIRGVIVAKGSESPVGHQITAVIAGPSGTVAGALASNDNSTEAATSEGGAPVRGGRGQSLPKMLLFAFIGGLILNIMPCVLPVIALKVLGFVNQSRESPARVRQLGLVYGLGVLCSFLLLAGIVIAVQHAGRAASWGMQFQNPKFLVAMTVLVTLVALNLFGVFEVNLSGRAMGAAGDLASKEGAAGAFFNGVLATTLATPCTAPFLAPALGFAFLQSAGVIILMFLTVGAGLAVPYIVLSWHPAWLRFLPRPGQWMEKFKNAMGFPMLATAVWLFSLTIAHFGKKGPLWFGVFLVLLTSAAWVWGEFVQRGRKRRGFAVGAAVAVLAVAYFAVLEAQLNWRSPVRKESAGGSIAGEPGGIEWQPWSAAAVAKARAEGRPVFVDFTADWCVTCQANKKTSIEISSVRAKLKEINAVTLLGDYTHEDEAITAELQRWGRAGVPLVLVYPADSTAEPLVLPEVLTPGIVLKALSKAAPQSGTKESGTSKGKEGTG
ncbi:MAG TPA: thioredoxin family protein, partial [Verrucomicrobiae bacterium]|nr:thioredoxin family protein [Verrucomicrobiae bacterium]